jgi:ferredoxin
MDQSVIFYFSGTGNSLYVAKRLAEGLGNARLVPVLQALELEEKALSYQQVGIVYPVYMNTAPEPVRTFLSTFDFTKVSYLFAIATHGPIPGKPGAYVNHLLKGKGRLLDEFFNIPMNSNSPKGVAPKPLMIKNWEQHITPDKVKNMKCKADAAIDHAIAALQEQQHTFRDIYYSDPKAYGHLLTKILWHIGGTSKPTLTFLLDDACTSCGTCQSVCLSGRIKMEGQHPAWQMQIPCYYCYACFNYCPEQAIGVKHYTKKEGRYHFPGITAQEIGSQKGSIPVQALES